MSELQALRGMLERLLERNPLNETDAGAVLVALTNPEIPTALSGALLAALRAKGVTGEELRGFARAMRELARRPVVTETLRSRAIDIVGTGGDASGSVNISTGTSLLVAACGIPVIKHGNRSISSRSGSADVLEKLGLSLPLDESRAGLCLERSGFTFLFAPYYHSTMKVIAPVRQALGVRTIFNILGPLTNPAAPPFALIGVFNEFTAELMAQALAGMPGLRRALVVHGANGWDEPTPIGPFTVFDVRAGRVQRGERQPADYGLATCTAADLTGGDAEFNAAALARVLRGEDLGAHRDALLLGAALALECTGQITEPRVGIATAAAAIDDGRAARVLQKIGEMHA
ncbi:MAG: anthranilate phosphoribosyltransferase [Gammaproteobacteria bacterium]|nr:anthranilate phosphoribosyltransferase [Gammaproteobacteria bacterium]